MPNSRRWRRHATLGAAVLVSGLCVGLVLLASGTSRAPASGDDERVQDGSRIATTSLTEGNVLDSASRGEAEPTADSKGTRHHAGPLVEEAPRVVETGGMATQIRGVVLDFDGRPVAGAEVWYEIGVPSGTAEGELARVLISSLTHTSTRGLAVKADAYGEFVFEETLAGGAGFVCVSATSHPDHILREMVDRRRARQVLRFPETPHQDSVWIVDVVDTNGKPVSMSGAEVRFIARTLAGPIRVPRQDEVEVQRGLVVVRGLPPGKWELRVEAPASLGGQITMSIASPRSTERSRLVLEVFMGSHVASATIEPIHEGLPWVDESAAVTSLIPKARLALGEEALDRHFRATLKAGSGEVLAAELVLDLRASQYLCENDSLSLEYVQDQGFAWGGSIQGLLGVEWVVGATARLRLDLTRLPLADGKTLDLRAHLADGLLDVVIQDDTAIDGLWLRIVR